MGDFETITLDITDGLATLTLNQPDRLNALSGQMNADLLAAFRALRSQGSGARALMITGAGRGFCAGADLSQGAMNQAERDLGASLIDGYHPMLQELSSLEIPVLTAVNGVAAGAGMSLALSSDIVVASRSAYFLQAFVNIGLIPDAGSTYILPRLIGDARARAMMMLGEKVPAETARDWGMIHDVLDDDVFHEGALTLARRLATGPTVALSGIRKLMQQTHKNGYGDQLQAEAMTQRIAGKSGDAVEGVMAFLQKRPTNFKGQ